MKKRFIKALAYRGVVMLAHMICLYLYTGNVWNSLIFSLLFSVIATTLYITFDKYWVIK